jgi:hypothetical protein
VELDVGGLAGFIGGIEDTIFIDGFSGSFCFALWVLSGWLNMSLFISL